MTPETFLKRLIVNALLAFSRGKMIYSSVPCTPVWITNTGKWRLKDCNTATEKLHWGGKNLETISFQFIILCPWCWNETSCFRPALIPPSPHTPTSPSIPQSHICRQFTRRRLAPLVWLFILWLVASRHRHVWSPSDLGNGDVWRGEKVQLLKESALHPPRSLVRPLNTAWKSERLFRKKKNPLKSTGEFSLFFCYFFCIFKYLAQQWSVCFLTEIVKIEQSWPHRNVEKKVVLCKWQQIVHVGMFV